MGIFRDLLLFNDSFGYYVNLNLDKKDSHNTVCGGIISILTKLTLCAFLYLRLEMMFTGGGDDNSSQVRLLGVREREETYLYKDIEFMLTPGIRSVKEGKKVLDYDSLDVKKHIELTYVQMF